MDKHDQLYLGLSLFFADLGASADSRADMAYHAAKFIAAARNALVARTQKHAPPTVTDAMVEAALKVPMRYPQHRPARSDEGYLRARIRVDPDEGGIEYVMRLAIQAALEEGGFGR